MINNKKWPIIRNILIDDGAPLEFIALYKLYYQQLSRGELGLIAEDDIVPLRDPPHHDNCRDTAALGERARKHVVLMKLNGGLGTGMGTEGPKSLLKVRGERSFFELTARQAEHDRIPLILMNTDATETPALEHLNERGLSPGGKLPLSFRQHRAPKLNVDFVPFQRVGGEIGWYPPGDGDFYLALKTSGTLKRLLDSGYQYAFVSDADNIGAVFDPAILGWMIRGGHPLVMEVSERTHGDRKGGHLALQKSDGRLLIREYAQCHAKDAKWFQDMARHSFFNTNNLWIDLCETNRWLQMDASATALPLIANRKTLDPRDRHSQPIWQIETAIGAAVSLFENAAAIQVSRDRFRPVKNTSDLLCLRSNCSQDTAGSRVAADSWEKPCLVELGDAHVR